ncbi:Uncharacterized membrane protein YkvI [Amphibacillus marinus]|uniref:Uncharacterized membrane protein YkvI n=1 Tax=Amphibacillus marinus TaxID=872970 RepID=A0A1H8PH76_9BACI|nr:hypothetical protein [Amphibacillus marinus]SEO40893.1 Uncharacterized membrane protein YkvI [Amphibacillus marinus]
MRRSYQWIFLIIGTVIGAGYASGREIWQFFGQGNGQAVILFGVLFSMCCYTMLSISFQEQSKDYIPLLTILVGPRLAKFYDMMTFVYLLSMTVVMIAGSGVALQAFQLPKWLGIIVTTLVIICTFLFQVNAIIKMNSLITPILIMALIAVIIAFNIKFQGYQESLFFSKDPMLLAAIPFTALNILPLLSCISAVGNQIKSKQEVMFTSIASGLVLSVLSLIYLTSLKKISEHIERFDMPLYALLQQFSGIIVLSMTLFIWLAIYTTAVIGMIGLIARIEVQIALSKKTIAFWLAIFILPLSFIGFKTLIQYLYPLYGYLNLYLLLTMLIYPLKTWYKDKKK